MLLAACAPQRGLVLLKAPPAVDWQDDGSALRLSQAIDQSVAYYRTLPPDTTFHFGKLVYSPQELIASLQLFRETYLAAPDPETLAREIAKRFYVFDSLSQEGDNLFTGYYEPQLEASATPTDQLSTPLYALPDDLVKVHLGQFSDNLPPVTLMGRVVGGELVPYYTRKQIQSDHALVQSAKPIAYVDPVELFFLQVQGSGVLHFPDGQQVQVGYAGSNGQPYRSIGALLVRNDAIPLAEVSMQSIRAWLRAHPEQQRKVLFANPSYVFFQVRDKGPLGNLSVPLTPGRSLAADQRVIPAGTLAYVVTQVPVVGSTTQTRTLERFMLVQDTGGAIRGNGRADLFWGAGSDAAWIAGHQRGTGRLLLLVARKAYLPPAAPAAPAPVNPAPGPSGAPKPTTAAAESAGAPAIQGKPATAIPTAPAAGTAATRPAPSGSSGSASAGASTAPPPAAPATSGKPATAVPAAAAAGSAAMKPEANGATGPASAGASTAAPAGAPSAPAAAAPGAAERAAPGSAGKDSAKRIAGQSPTRGAGTQATEGEPLPPAAQPRPTVGN